MSLLIIKLVDPKKRDRPRLQKIMLDLDRVLKIFLNSSLYLYLSLLAAGMPQLPLSPPLCVGSSGSHGQVTTVTTLETGSSGSRESRKYQSSGCGLHKTTTMLSLISLVYNYESDYFSPVISIMLHHGLTK